MQKQPKLPYVYYGIKLDEEFPFAVSGVYEQKDREITRLHFHDAPELGICLEGSGVFIVEGRILPFKGGDIIYIADGARHLAQSARGTVSRWRWIYFDLEKLLCPAFRNTELASGAKFRDASFPCLIQPESLPALCASAKALLDIWQRRGLFMKEKLLAALAIFAAELHEAFPRCGAGSMPEDEDAPAPDKEVAQRLNSSIERLLQLHGRKISIAQMAKDSGFSETQFRRLFKKAFGRSPRSYLNQIRIAMALAELSRSSRKAIAEIALDCGFETLSSFNRQFKEQMGCSPREWRRKRREPAFLADAAAQGS